MKETVGSKKKNKKIDTDKLLSAVGAVVDRADKIVDIATKAGVGYAGYVAFQHPFGALFSLLGLQLAQSQNLAAGAAGVGMLATVGATDGFRLVGLMAQQQAATGTPHPLSIFANQFLQALGLLPRA